MNQGTRTSPVSRRRLRLAVVALLGIMTPCATLLAKPGGAPPGIHGKVSGWEHLIPEVYADAAKDDMRRYVWREPSPTVNSDFRKLSANVARDVCVAVFGTAPAPAHEPFSVKVTGGRITPSTIVLAPGSRISFKNVDPFPHVLYESGNVQWAPNEIAPGSAREWSSGVAGVHVIRDQLFPSVVTYVVIDPMAVEFAVPDHQGTFAMTVPPGDYSIKIFFEGKAVGHDSAHVGTGAAEIKDPIAIGGGDSK